jgi:colanic acid biosynthesis glycosyl transferase WcaI
VSNEGGRKQRRVWIVSELYYPEETSTGYLLTRIAEHIAVKREVHVLCSQPTYRARGIRAPERETRNGVQIERVKGTSFDKNSLPGRLVNMLTISASLFTTSLRRFEADDVVIVVTNPPLLPFLTALASRMRGAETVVLVHDVYPEVLVASGLTERTSVLSRTVAALTRLLYRSVSRIIVIGRDMEALVRQKLPRGDDRVVLIPNWADVDTVVPQAREANPILKDEGLLPKLVLQYAGNMGRSHDIESILAAPAKKDFPSDLVFLFAGDGAKRRLIERAEQSLDNGHVRLLQPFGRDKQSEFLNACDVAIISFVPGMAGISVPSRMYNILAAGKPILAIADPDSELALVIRENGVGWVVEPGNEPAFLAALREVSNSRASLPAMGVRARRIAEEFYAAEKVLSGYDKLLSELTTS